MERKGRFVSYELWVFDRQTKIINQAETEFIMCINHGHYLLISFIILTSIIDEYIPISMSSENRDVKI